MTRKIKFLTKVTLEMKNLLNQLEKVITGKEEATGSNRKNL